MKKRTILTVLSLIGFTLLLSGCGTVSPLRMKMADPALFKNRYDKVIIERFTSKDVKTDVDQRKIDLACDNFADLIVNEIKATGAFSEVTKEKASGDVALLIGGNINQYTEGDAALRLLIGCGAGSVYFKALVQFHDGSTKEEIGSMVVDNNSWVLGGVCAATQTPETFMMGAAKKIASETACLGRK